MPSPSRRWRAIAARTIHTSRCTLRRAESSNIQEQRIEAAYRSRLLNRRFPSFSSRLSLSTTEEARRLDSVDETSTEGERRNKKPCAGGLDLDVSNSLRCNEHVGRIPQIDLREVVRSGLLNQ